MDNYDTNNRKLIMPAITMGLALVIFMGVTYAWLTKVLTGEQIQRITAAQLELELDDKTREGINLDKAIPMSDTEGLGTDAYTFTVTNKGDTNVSYKIYLDDMEVDGERLPDNLVKYNITRNGKTIKTALLQSSQKEENNKTVRVLDDTIIEKRNGSSNKVNSYTLKLWIDSSATTDIAGKIFKGKIRLEGVQTEEEAPLEYTYTNQHIKAAYTYNEEGTGTGAEYTGCLGGAEAGCEQISLTSSDSVPVGTVIKYEVASGVVKYFNVLHDNGDKLVMQERENTVSNVKWAEVISDGPTTALSALESATQNWTNVNTFSYTIGEESDSLGYSGFHSGVGYSRLVKNDVKVRMVTAHEAVDLGLESTPKKFMNNYTGFGESFAISDCYGYWTMNASTEYYGNVLAIQGFLSNFSPNNDQLGARAVVEINK